MDSCWPPSATPDPVLFLGPTRLYRMVREVVEDDGPAPEDLSGGSGRDPPRVRIETTANLCARLLRQADPDFLIPELNAPHVGAREVRARISSAGGSRATLADPEASVATKEQAAAEVARDNQRRDGGLLAAAAMQAAAGRPDYPEVQRVANEMLGHYTFYRDLLPTGMHSVRGGEALHAGTVSRLVHPEDLS